jgi:two-component system response regulator YesN
MYKLLIVEDERREREGLIGFLDWESLGVCLAGAARDGREGLELAKDLTPDIVITDIRMPLMDGLEMIRRLRAFLPDGQIIIVSGYDEFSYAKQAISLGVSEYILKPVEEEPLVNAVRAAISRREAVRGFALDPVMMAEVAGLESYSGRVAYSIRSLDLPRVSRAVTLLFDAIGSRKLPGMASVEVVRRSIFEIARELTALGISSEGIIGASADLERAIGPSATDSMRTAALMGIAERAVRAARERLSERSKDAVAEAIAIVERDYGKAIGLKTIADSIGLSPNYLGKIFAEATGRQFNDFLTSCRMEKARTLLDKGALKVQAVAEEVGYPNVPYFCTLFKNTHGLSPGEFQKRPRTPSS